MLKSSITITSQIVLIRRSFFSTEGSSEDVSSPSRSGEIRLRLVILLSLTNVIILQVALIVHHGNESETRATLQYTHTHYTLVRLCGLVLCTSATRLRKDELTCDRERGNESEMHEECDITTPPGTFSPCSPITNKISYRKI